MRDIENPGLLHENRLPPRSTLIPSHKADTFYYNKEESAYIFMLSGEYDFTYYEEEGVAPRTGKIAVPSMWQFQGYAIPRYTNTVYPFPFNPPYTGLYNPVGVYKRSFFLNKKPKKAILHFEGVDNAFYASVNGIEVGFSKGSRMPAEFLVAALLTEGENTLEVKVYTYSDASYLEGQDMVLASGIFRDVYLILTDEVSLWDYKIKTCMNRIEVEVFLDYAGQPGYALSVHVNGETKTAQVKDNSYSFFFEIENPVLWNAEEPYLYDVVIRLNEEVHTKKAGLREIEIIDGVLCLNRVPVKLKGVNRHEYLPEHGRAIDCATTEKELKLIKDCNLNAVRCAHYPNNPYFYELASRLGIYVVDEADLETHGCGVTGDQGYLSKKEQWQEAYLDRVIRMYERDKNETCIIIWSLGNECGNGPNLVACAEWIKNADIKKPVLYPQDNASAPEFTDFRQCGYCNLWVLDRLAHETGKIGNNHQPVIMTEYAHAMGNGPGGLSDYWDKIYQYKQFCGGFVWELKNHGIYRGGKYLYGGDFGEASHALNFNLDGVLFSDGSQKPSMYELKEVSAPVAAYYDNGVCILNRHDFKNLDYLDIKWEVIEDYTVVSRGGTQKLDLAPGAVKRLDLPGVEQLIAGAAYRVNLYFFKKDFLVSKKQIDLPYGLPKEELPAEKINWSDHRITAGNYEFRFENGMIASYTYNGAELLKRPVSFCFYRKPTDNDGIKGKSETLIHSWEKGLLPYMNFFPENCLAAEDEVIFKGKILPEGMFLGFNTEIKYKVLQGGLLMMSVTAKPYGNMPEILPRIGLLLALEKEYNRVLWYGRGEHENYPDRKASANFGLYEKKIEQMSVPYERPQENGNRCDTYFLAALNNSAAGIAVYGSDSFQFSAHNYALGQLIQAAHSGEIQESGHNYLYIDYMQRGLGSASCGPHPEEAYELHPHDFNFTIGIKAFSGMEKACGLIRKSFPCKTGRLSENYKYENPQKARENFECR